jgi:hypothetical protein
MPEHQNIKQSRGTQSSQRQIIPAKQVHASNSTAIIQRARIDPKSLTSAEVLQLQRTIGNRAVGRLLSEIKNSSTVQQTPVQRQEMPEEEETCPSCVQKHEIQEEKEPLQGMFENKPEKAICPSCVQRKEIPEEEEHLQMKKENNTGMPDSLKAGVESLSGIDMSDVRVYYNSPKPVEVGALAYTQGTDIHVAPGQERHLPHEAWHVVQQAQGRVRPTMQVKGVAVNDDVRLEMEAGMIGDMANRSGITTRIEISSMSLNKNNARSPYVVQNYTSEQVKYTDEKAELVRKERAEKRDYNANVNYASLTDNNGTFVHESSGISFHSEMLVIGESSLKMMDTLNLDKMPLLENYSNKNLFRGKAILYTEREPCEYGNFGGLSCKRALNIALTENDDVFWSFKEHEREALEQSLRELKQHSSEPMSVESLDLQVELPQTISSSQGSLVDYILTSKKVANLINQIVEGLSLRIVLSEQISDLREVVNEALNISFSLNLDDSIEWNSVCEEAEKLYNIGFKREIGIDNDLEGVAQKLLILISKLTGY